MGFGIHDFKINIRLCQHTVSHFAVWTGGCGKEKNLIPGSGNFRLGLCLIIMDFFWFKDGGFKIVNLTIFKFLGFSFVPVLDWTVVAGNTAVDFRFTAADRTGILFAADIAMVFTDGIGW